MILIKVSAHFELPENTSGNCIQHSTSEEENKQSFLVIYLQCSCSELKEARESNDTTSATIDVEVYNYLSALSQSEDIAGRLGPQPQAVDLLLFDFWAYTTEFVQYPIDDVQYAYT